MPDRKLKFVVNLPLKLLRATFANADIDRYIPEKYLYLLNVSEIWTNRMVQTTRKFELFDKVLTPFWKMFFVAEKIV